MRKRYSRTAERVVSRTHCIGLRGIRLIEEHREASSFERRAAATVLEVMCRCVEQVVRQELTPLHVHRVDPRGGELLRRAK